MSEIEWGTVPAWLSGVGGSVALLMTILIVRRDHRLRESAQAEEVYAAVVSHHWTSSSGRYTKLRLKAVNGSSAPVFRMTVEILDWDWKRPRSKKESKQRRALISVLIPTLMPRRESKEIDLDGEIQLDRADSADDGHLLLTPPVRFNFTDAAGRRWTRWPDGCLARVHEKKWPVVSA